VTLVVHSHFHRRRSGATTHIEAVVPELQRTMDVRTIGSRLSPALPHISVRELLHARGAIVWHSHRVNELIWGLLLRLVRGDTRLVFTRHHGGKPSWFTRFVVRRADRVIALTRDVARELTIPAEVVGHGIDLAHFSPPADRSESWRSLGLGGAYGIGVVGRVRPSKGSGDFAQAIASLLTSETAWHAVFVGLVLPRYARQARQWKALGGDKLHLVGEQLDIAAWYKGLTIVVQPSHAEGFGLVLIEAMASGCCVVAAHLPHYEEFIIHGTTGFFYPAGDVQALREILAALLADPARAQEVGRAAAEAARAFGVEREAAALARLYQE
jgi:mannosyltransferase